eukprot:gene30193-19913_t
MGQRDPEYGSYVISDVQKLPCPTAGPSPTPTSNAAPTAALAPTICSKNTISWTLALHQTDAAEWDKEAADDYGEIKSGGERFEDHLEWSLLIAYPRDFMPSIEAYAEWNLDGWNFDFAITERSSVTLDACATWSEPTADAGPPLFEWQLERGCCREKVGKSMYNHHATVSDVQ